MPRFILAASLLSLAACRISTTPAPSSVPPLLDRAEQLVVVTTPDWDSTSGTLRRFTRSKPGDEWHADGAPTPIVVGRTGLAWGRGFDANTLDATSPHKHEGDGRSPAGIFPLDTAFGFAPCRFRAVGSAAVCAAHPGLRLRRRHALGALQHRRRPLRCAARLVERRAHEADRTVPHRRDRGVQCGAA